MITNITEMKRIHGQSKNRKLNKNSNKHINPPIKTEIDQNIIQPVIKIPTPKVDINKSERVCLIYDNEKETSIDNKIKINPDKIEDDRNWDDDFEPVKPTKNKIRDKKVKSGVTPKEVKKEVEIDVSKLASISETLFFETPISLIVEIVENKNWTTLNVCDMHTIGSFWAHVNLLCGYNGTRNVFVSPKINMSNQENELFKNIIKCKDPAVKNSACNLYNSIFPVWTFKKLIDNDNITVPFIRDFTMKAINSIDVNISINPKSDIEILTNSFRGLIPNLIMEFSGGVLDFNITAIVFSRCVIRRGSFYNRGFRVRVLTETSDAATLNNCYEYIRSRIFTYNQKDCCDYHSIVSIVKPK